MALKKGMFVFSPLAQGLLTNRYLNGIPDDSRMKTDGRFLNERALSAEMLEKIKAYPNVVSVEQNIDSYPPDFP